MTLPRLALSLSLACLPAALLAQTAAYDPYHVLSVSGDAEVRVAPNLVFLSLGVETRDAQLPQARAANDAAVKRVIQALQSLRVAPADIQTDFMNVHMQYNNITPTAIDFYSVEKEIAVYIRNVPSFDSILGAVLDAGANHIYGVEFRTTELRKYRDQARAAAVKAAMEKASALAAAAGLQLDPKPLGLSNYTDGGGAWYGRLNGNNQFLSQNVAQAPTASPAEGTVAPGQISVTAAVTISFKLR